MGGIDEHRQHLVEERAKAQAYYDKTIILLSSGALGVSFSFVRDFLGTRPPQSVELLPLSWFSWAISLAAILGSFLASHQALTAAIRDHDKQIEPKEATQRRWTWLTILLNWTSGLAFLAGVVLLGVFVWMNVGGRLPDKPEITSTDLRPSIEVIRGLTPPPPPQASPLPVPLPAQSAGGVPANSSDSMGGSKD